MDLTVKSIVSYDQSILQEECQLHEQLINRIKDEVSQEYDNVNYPIPFASQLIGLS
jgi:hypothetical protein